MSYRSSPAFALGGATSKQIYGQCRVCGCTDDNACMVLIEGCEFAERPCGWFDHSHTLCDDPACLEEAGVPAARAAA